MTPSSADLSLPAALRACARGLYPLEAGVGLLISHACWLHREDFRDEFIHAGMSAFAASTNPSNKLPGKPSGLSSVCRRNGGIGDTRTPRATLAEP